MVLAMDTGKNDLCVQKESRPLGPVMQAQRQLSEAISLFGGRP